MLLVFSDDIYPTEVTKSIFLAGPNPRYKDGDAIENTWRHEAVRILEEKGYDGHVFIPLPKQFFFGETAEVTEENYDHQIEWEDATMSRADVLLFYVDRTEKLQGLTTNIEFGRYLESGRMVYGRPDDALNIRYLDEQIRKRQRKVHSSVEDCVDDALSRIGEGSVRYGDATLVPLIFWNTEQFQTWFNSHKGVGNVLKDFVPKSVVTCNTSGTPFCNDGFLFGFSAYVNIFIREEDRYKSNEWIFSRTSTSTVVPFYDHPEEGRKFILVREFRSPVNNPHSAIYEFPGGTGVETHDVDQYTNAKKELLEETKINVTDNDRFVFLGFRQTFGTFSINRMHAVAVSLTEEEYELAVKRSEKEEVLGECEEERITLCIASESDLLEERYPVDYTTLGLIYLVNVKVPFGSNTKQIALENRNPFFV